ncbi:Transferase domain-containing protein [Cephalotus follicularis]|uniref:Transferase domain-containing protein n=1 Tax=Cephalotus follicularis TaxID=3775 RepID=A0A1Q3BBW3_CEPFO|nr:Transferase domain-containing protein [Cephalotus follicularis]
MKDLNQKSSPPPQDLKATIQNISLVFPSQETEQRSMFLSNIDQVLNFTVETVHFFGANVEYPFNIVTEKLKNTLANILVPYDFMAGRLKLNSKTGRLEIDCNAAGAGFVVASTDYKLDEIGDLVYPNPAFAQLALKTMDNLPQEDQPLCILQLTSFKCGGFAMGISTSHATFDGLSFKTFLDNLAALASDKPLSVIPCHDRHLLAARSPPRVTFPHPELLKIKVPIGQDQSNPTTVFEATPEELDFNIFSLTSGDITKLKEKAKADTNNGAQTHTRISGFNAIAALIWRCKALSCKDLERLSTILYAVDIRPRLNPPLPASYAGNAVLTAYATAKCEEISQAPFSKLVEMVSEGAKRMTDEYAKSAIDWGEIYKGFPHGEVLVSSWWKLGFADVEYPWGKPRYSCPVVYHRKDIILLFPDIDDSNGVNILVALPSKQMDVFQNLFKEFMA